MRHVLTLNVSATMIFIFIVTVIDDLKHFQEICMIIHICLRWGSLAKKGKSSVPFL